jgi:hypothetical protein
MSKAPLLFVALISLAGVAKAQGKFGDVTTSTDPARAAMVEKQAAELKATQTHHMSHAMRHHASLVAGHRLPVQECEQELNRWGRFDAGPTSSANGVWFRLDDAPAPPRATL